MAGLLCSLTSTVFQTSTPHFVKNGTKTWITFGLLLPTIRYGHSRAIYTGKIKRIPHKTQTAPCKRHVKTRFIDEQCSSQIRRILATFQRNVLFIRYSLRLYSAVLEIVLGTISDWQFALQGLLAAWAIKNSELWKAGEEKGLVQRILDVLKVIMPRGYERWYRGMAATFFTCALVNNQLK